MTDETNLIGFSFEEVAAQLPPKGVTMRTAAPAKWAFGYGTGGTRLPVTRYVLARHSSMRIPPKLLALAALGISACAAPPANVDKRRDQMTQREKDSVLAVSKFVGAGVVNKALSVSDAQEKRAASYDSAGQ